MRCGAQPQVFLVTGDSAMSPYSTVCLAFVLGALGQLAVAATPTKLTEVSKVDRVAASRDGSVLLTFTSGVTLPTAPDRNEPSSFLQWDPTADRLVRELSVVVDGRDAQYVEGLAISPDGKFAALVCSEIGSILMFDLGSGERTIAPYEGGSEEVYLGFSPDGGKLVGVVPGDGSAALAILDRKTSKTQMVPLGGPVAFIGAVCSPVESQIIVSRVLRGAGQGRAKTVIEI